MCIRNVCIMWPGYINTRDKWAHSYECFILFITWCKTIQFLSFLWRRKVKVKVTQLCPTLCDPTDSTVHGILQARILEWVAFPFSRGSSELRDQTEVSQIAGGFFTSWATRGNPRRLEWITYPFSSRSSQPRNQTRVSGIAGGLFTNWAIREAHGLGRRFICIGWKPWRLRASQQQQNQLEYLRGRKKRGICFSASRLQGRASY